MDAHRHPTVTAGAQRIQALKAGGQRDARSRNTWALYR
jgi:hypothetical protein